MNKFKEIVVPALTVGLLLSASSAFAHEVRFDTIDRNAAGFLIRAELAAVFGREALSL